MTIKMKAGKRTGTWNYEMLTRNDSVRDDIYLYMEGNLITYTGCAPSGRDATRVSQR